MSQAAVWSAVQDSQLLIEQHKTGFTPPGDIPFDDLSDPGMSPAALSTVKTETVRGTVGKGGRRRTGLRALFNTAKVVTPQRLSSLTSHWL